MIHLDLFSGICGFSLAVDWVWPDAEHIFCDIDPYCRQLIKLRYPNSKIYGDIRTIQNIGTVDLITGGFPCQPFSQAGKQGGKEDDRWLWPQMLRVIKECQPTWIIGENVAGLINMVQFDNEPELDDKGCAVDEMGATWSGTGQGILEEILESLEAEGYEVQSFIVPACAVNAPHRRDRVWIVGYSASNGYKGRHQKAIGTERQSEQGGLLQSSGADRNVTDPASERNRRCTSEECTIQKRELVSGEQEGSEIRCEGEGCACDDSDNTNKGLEGNDTERNEQAKRRLAQCDRDDTDTTSGRCGQCVSSRKKTYDTCEESEWNGRTENWLEVATELCMLDDGLPSTLDGFELSKPRHRTERIKALGNAIVPAVVFEIMKAIKQL